MRYWEDMQDKWGFSDGNAIPEGIEVYRDVYVRVVNRLATRFGSKYRAAPYDRGGVHNWCLIVSHLVDDVDEFGTDTAYEEAVDEAMIMFVDECIEVVATIWDERLNELYETIDAMGAPDGDH